MDDGPPPDVLPCGEPQCHFSFEVVRSLGTEGTDTVRGGPSQSSRIHTELQPGCAIAAPAHHEAPPEFPVSG